MSLRRFRFKPNKAEVCNEKANTDPADKYKFVRDIAERDGFKVDDETYEKVMDKEYLTEEGQEVNRLWRILGNDNGKWLGVGKRHVLDVCRGSEWDKVWEAIEFRDIDALERAIEFVESTEQQEGQEGKSEDETTA